MQWHRGYYWLRWQMRLRTASPTGPRGTTGDQAFRYWQRKKLSHRSDSDRQEPHKGTTDQQETGPTGATEANRSHWPHLCRCIGGQTGATGAKGATVPNWSHRPQLEPQDSQELQFNRRSGTSVAVTGDPGATGQTVATG